MNLFKSILYTILSIQESILKLRLSKTLNAKNFSLKKVHYYKGSTLTLSSLAENEKQRLEEELKLILTRYNYNPEKILEYIQTQGTKVIHLDNAARLLNSIGENEGFIYPSKGAKAVYISLITKKSIQFRTNEMFILSKGNINKYYFIYHLYNWFAYKHKIAGLDPESQNLLKKYLFETTDTKQLQLSEIYKLKDAINQDKAAIEFVIKLCRNFEGTKQALEKMQKLGSANL